MQNQQLRLHKEYINTPDQPDPHFISILNQRRQKLLTLIDEQEKGRNQSDEVSLEQRRWVARTYPVLAVLAPALETNEGKIEYPGDPMCLYSALSVTIDEVIKARAREITQEPENIENKLYAYNDLCPE